MTNKKIEVLLDNGGGILLQTTKFVHSYDRAEDCANDIHTFLRTGDTSEWEGNQPAFRRLPHPTDDILTRADIEAIITAGEIIARVGSGYTGAELIARLLGPRACEAVAKGDGNL